MSLPINLPQFEEKWDCHQCGVCCRGSVIPLSAADYQRLNAQGWDRHPEMRGVNFLVKQAGAASGYRLAHRRDGSCVFLQPNGLCRIHAEHGATAKPTVCQVFPLQLVPRHKQSVLTVRRACPSAAAELGRPVSQHLPSIKQKVREQELTSETISPPEIKRGEARPWPVVLQLFAAVERLLNDQRFPPVRRVVHTLQFANLLSTAKTSQLNVSKLGELVQTLADLAPEEARPLFSERQEPKGYSKVMFRLMAIDVARLHPECRHVPGWQARLQLMRIAWRIVLGTGRAPYVDRIFPRVSFQQLEQPTGALPPEVYSPLTRWLESSAASYLYGLADRRDWTVLESIRGLAIRFPVGLWLLRWIGQARLQPSSDRPGLQITASDMVALVVALDRSQGYSPLSGALHRQRLTTLGADEQLERLVIWYAQ